MISKCYVIASLLLSLLTTVSTQATPVKRQLLLGVTAAHYDSNSFGTNNQSPIGISSRYEFILKPRFTIGIQCDYRYLIDRTPLHQLNYGLILRHQLSFLDNYFTRPIFFSYGILMQAVQNQEGWGHAHDTKVALDLPVTNDKNPFYAELAYHYSRLRYFKAPTKNLDHMSVSIGKYFSF